MFDVRLMSHGKYQAVVTATGYLSSMDDVAEIECEFRSQL